MTRSLPLSILIILGILGAQPCLMARSCAYGTGETWVSIANGAWMPATQHPHLRPGDTLEVIVKIKATIPLSKVFCELHEFGTPVYEVLKGPSRINELLCLGTTGPDSVVCFLWQIRILPETRWINGTAPLEVFIQFTKSDDESRTITFDALCSIIEKPFQPLANHVDSNVVYQQPVEPIPLILTGILITISIGGHLKKRWF
jgi:hypothetical protein